MRAPGGVYIFSRELQDFQGAELGKYFPQVLRALFLGQPP